MFDINNEVNNIFNKVLDKERIKRLTELKKQQELRRQMDGDLTHDEELQIDLDR